MPFYLAHVHDSDGNNNNISKLIVEAEDLDAAYEVAANEVETRLKQNNVEWESDGNFGGYYECDCDIPEGEENHWECSHGGWSLYIEECDEYPTEAEAIRHCQLEYYNPMF